MQPSIVSDPTQGQSDSHDSPLRERFKRQVRIEADHNEAKQEACAREMRVDPSLISHWGAERGCDMPAWRLIGWTRTYGAGLLRWVAAQCGYEIVPTGPVSSKHDAQVLIALFSRHSGAALAQTIENIASDGAWTTEEKQADLRTWQRIQSFVNSIVDALEREARR